MFIVLLKLTDNRDQAGQFMDGHKAWIQAGFDDGVFLLVGSLEPGLGGSLLAHQTTRPELQARVEQDPFVAQQVVTAEILEIDPSRTDSRLDFLVTA